jgi:hypothetical protein
MVIASSMVGMYIYNFTTTVALCQQKRRSISVTIGIAAAFIYYRFGRSS